ncbi:MAG: NAD(P)H-binding protein, partial [Propionibacteriaceae bacterium]
MLVLVTGGSGFVGAHCLRQLLSQGHQVRTTVRSPQRAEAVRAMVEPGADVSFAVADLNSDDGWATAVAGCDAVLHVASPFPGSEPKNADALVIPAREGTLRALRAAR